MARIALHDATLDLGHGKLLDGASFAIEPGERIALVGRNGAGKSTLLRVLLGEQPLDGGRVDRQQGLRMAWLPQEVPTGLHGTVFDCVAEGLGDVGRTCAESRRLASDPDADPDAWARVHEALDAAGGWDAPARVERAVERAELDPDADVATLSGGQKRRALLARATLAGADLLLLDEPTNHLDVPSIEALERMLTEDGHTVLFVSHDRAFVDRVATRIVDLDRGRITSWPPGWERFLEAREAQRAEEERHDALFDKRLAEEEAWIRRGVQARRTRDMGRVARLQAMRRERAERRSRPGQARIAVADAERSGRLVVETEGLAFAWPAPEGRAEPIVDGLDLILLRGDRLAIMGPNGTGKTTLLELLFGSLVPDAGRVRRGTNLQIARFDQLRESLDPERTVMDTVGDGADRIEVGGRVRHVAGYLRDFLFDADRLRSRVRTLSGGERNRLLLARLFTRPANLLILDEPTNDLDIETLELLETLIEEFEGTVIVVSHDRAFVDRVASSTLYLAGGGEAVEYAGGYTDAMEQRRRAPESGGGSSATSGPVPARGSTPPPPPEAPRPTRTERVDAAPSARRLTQWEKRELEGLPEAMEAQEARIAELEKAAQDPAIWADGGAAAADLTARIGEAQAKLDALMERWMDLEARSEASRG